MIKTLLANYIRAQLSQYEEPSREGVAKGDEIGFSRAKLATVLLSLTLLPVKDIAEMASVSYGVLRFWRTEKRYRKLIDSHTRMFSEEFLKVIDLVAERNPISLREYQATGGFLPTGSELDDFFDFPLYARSVLSEIRGSTIRKEFQGSSSMFTSALAWVWGIRKGWLARTADGQYNLTRSAPLECSVPGNLFSLARFLEEPWNPPKESVAQARENFGIQMKGVL